MAAVDEDESRRRSLNSLIINGGREVLKHKVDEKTKEPCLTLPQFLKKAETQQEMLQLQERNIISQEQYDMLYLSTGTVSSEQLDFPLLVVLLRTFWCSVSRDDQLWYKGNEPDVNDISIEAEIVRLRDIKNEILRRMGNEIESLDATLVTLKELQHNPEDERKLEDELQRWTEMDLEYECGLDLAPSESRSRRLRLFALITDGSCRVLRQLFDNRIPPSRIISAIKCKKAKLLDLNEKRIIKSPQHKLLFPSTGLPSSENFDISLLCIVLENIAGYGSAIRTVNDPSKNDTTQEADIARLRQYRNEIDHIPKTRGISEVDFEDMWEKINQILLRLDGACGNSLPNLQLELDKLKSDPLDHKREQDLEDGIKAWIEMDKLHECKVIKTIEKHSLTEGAKARSKETVKDVLSDRYFVKTTQFKEALLRLRAKNLIVLNGVPGEGKTTIAKKLLLEVSTHDRYIQLNTYSDWDNVILDTVDVVLIDNMFGSGMFDKDECRKWQKHIPSIAAAIESRNLYVVITSRTYILADALDKMTVESIIFCKDNIVALSSKDISENDKALILNNHFFKASHNNDTITQLMATRKHKQLVKDIVKLHLDGPDSSSTIGFPECARLFSSNDTLYNEGVEFFKSPMTGVKTCISSLLNNDDAFVAFFVLWAQTSKSLTSIDIEHPVHKTPDKIIEPIHSLQYRPEDHIRKIRHVLHTHRGGFIHFDCKREIFSFTHRVVRDAVGLVGYEKNTTAVLQYCDQSFIENYIYIETTETEQSRIDKEVEKHRDDTQPISGTKKTVQDISAHAEPILDESGSEDCQQESIIPEASTLRGSEDQISVQVRCQGETSAHESNVTANQPDSNTYELTEPEGTVNDIGESEEPRGDQDTASSPGESKDDTKLHETNAFGLESHSIRIQLNHTRHKQLSLRMGTLLTTDIQQNDSDNYLDVSLFKHTIFESEEFCGTFFYAMRKTNYSVLQKLLHTTIRTLEREFAEFTFFKNVNSKIRLPSYLLWIKEQPCPLVVKAFDAMASMDVDLLKRELHISMLISAKLGNCTLVKFLLGKGAKIDINMISIARAKQNDEMVDYILKTITELACSTETLLHDVCEAGYTEIALKLIQMGSSTGEKDGNGHCPIHIAAIQGNIKMVCAMLEIDSSQANIPCTYVSNAHLAEATLFHVAACSENGNLVDVLIKHGIHANVRDANGRTPFMLAVLLGHRIVYKFLRIAVQDEVQSTPDKDNNTPLLIAIKEIARAKRNSNRQLESLYMKIAMELCTYEKNIYLENSEGDTALSVAFKHGLGNIVNTIVRHCFPSRKKESALFSIKRRYASDP